MATPYSFFPVEQEDFFGKWQAWQDKVMHEYSATVRDPHFQDVTRHSLNLKEILDALPRARRNQLMSEYKRNILGFDDVISNSAENRYWLKEPTVRAGRSKGGVARLTINPEQLPGGGAVDPRAVLFNRLYLQHDPETGNFNIGTRVPNIDFFRNQLEDRVEGNPLGPDKRIVVFDTETGGLRVESGMRQLSATVMTTDAQGALSAITDKPAIDVHLRTARMQMGYLAGPDGTAQRMSDVIPMRTGKPYANARIGSGSDFVESLRPFLDQAAQADHLIGHNIDFDIKQTLVGLTHTTAYKENTGGFADLIGEVQKRLGRKGFIRDTLTMAQDALPDLRPARELSFAGDSVSSHSLQNLILQTNLVDKIREEVGDDTRFKSIMGLDDSFTIQHSSDFDATITAYLHKILQEKTLRAGTLGEDVGGEFGQALRKRGLQSYGITPISTITDIGDITRDMFKALVQEGGGVRVWQDATNVTGVDPDDLYDLLSGDKGYHAAFNVTPMEQEIFHTRNIGLNVAGDVSREQVTYGLGQWENFAKSHEKNKGFLNKFQTLFRKGERPAQSEFEKVQRGMARSGTPFAGLSLPERWLTSAMAGITSLGSFGGEEKFAARVGDDIGISRFLAQENFYLSRTGKNISIPFEIMEEAKRLKVLSRPSTEMFTLSPFEADDGSKYVNLMMNFKDESESSAFTKWFSELTPDTMIGEKRVGDFGVNRRKLSQITEALPKIPLARGLGIAQLTGDAGLRGFELLESFYQGLVSDEARLPIKTALMDSQNGMVRTVGMVLDRFWTSSEERNRYIGENKGLAFKRLEDLHGISQDKTLRTAAEDVVETGHSDMYRKIMHGYDAVSKRFPLVVGAAALGAGAYYIYNKKKEQSIFDETLETQPYQNATDYRNYRREMGLPPAPAVRKMFPLQTAGVVGNADRNKVNHTLMGTNKYQNIYAGAL